MTGNDYNTQQNISRQSEFNEAGEQLRRIGEQWNLCHGFRLRGNIQKWNVSLDNVWMELVADTNEDGDDEKKMKEFNSEYLKNKKNNSLAYQTLIKKETFLRRLQESQNKGGKKKEDTRGL